MGRFIAHSVLFVSVFFLPWFIAALFGIYATATQKKFFEIVVWGFLYDIVYGTEHGAVFGISFFFTVSAIILVFAVEYGKKKIRFNPYRTV